MTRWWVRASVRRFLSTKLNHNMWWKITLRAASIRLHLIVGFPPSLTDECCSSNIIDRPVLEKNAISADGIASSQSWYDIFIISKRSNLGALCKHWLCWSNIWWRRRQMRLLLLSCPASGEADSVILWPNREGANLKFWIFHPEWFCGALNCVAAQAP